jgi:hypothetical protein
MGESRWWGKRGAREIAIAGKSVEALSFSPFRGEGVKA